MKDTLILIGALFLAYGLSRLIPVELPAYIETKDGYLIRDKNKWADDLLIKHNKKGE